MLKKLETEKPAPAPVAPYEPTPQEQAALTSNTARREKRSPLVPLKLLSVEKGKASIQVDHRDPVAERMRRARGSGATLAGLTVESW